MDHSKLKEPVIVSLDKPITVLGLTMKTGMKSVFQDVTKVLKQYMSYKEKYGIPNQKVPWEYISLSSNFSDDQTWDYFTGHVVNRITESPEQFTAFEVPAGRYAVFSVRPRFKFMLGVAIGKTKKYIYDVWLPKSGYEFAGYEFEYNDEKMFQEHPHFIDLYIAVNEKNRYEKENVGILQS